MHTLTITNEINDNLEIGTIDGMYCIIYNGYALGASDDSSVPYFPAGGFNVVYDIVRGDDGIRGFVVGTVVNAFPVVRTTRNRYKLLWV